MHFKAVKHQTDEINDEKKYEYQILMQKYKEITEKRDINAAKILLKYKPLRNATEFTDLKETLMLFFIKVFSHTNSAEINCTTFLDVLEIKLCEAANTKDYCVLFCLIEHSIAKKYLIFARRLLNSCAKEGWISVRFFLFAAKAKK